MFDNTIFINNDFLKLSTEIFRDKYLSNLDSYLENLFLKFQLEQIHYDSWDDEDPPLVKTNKILDFFEYLLKVPHLSSPIVVHCLYVFITYYYFGKICVVLGLE